MARFRYKGVVVSGEVTDADGAVMPNIIESTDVYGYTFNKRTYTEVPDDAMVKGYGRRLDRDEAKLVATKVRIIDKLAENREFEMHAEDRAKYEEKAA